MTITHTILPTTNEACGFFGTIRHDADPDEAWRIAFQAITAATGGSPEGVRDVLDSRHGRHLADEVAGTVQMGRGLERAVSEAVQTWMGWRIDRRTEREHGIPRGLPYLTGWVTHFEILADAEA